MGKGMTIAVGLVLAAGCGSDPGGEDEDGTTEAVGTTGNETTAGPTASTETGSDATNSTGASADGTGTAGETDTAETGAETGADATGDTEGDTETGGPVIPPVALCSGEVVESFGLAYADDHPDRNLLDLYVPQDGGPCPLLMWVHGGAWQAGSRQLGGAIAARLERQRDRGYAIASIDYRFSSDAEFPAQIHDVKAALRWVRANAETYNIDPHRIVVMGASAGGHLVALAGTSGGEAMLEDLGQGNADQPSDVHGVIDCYGPTDFALMDEQAADNGCGPGSQNHSNPGSPESNLVDCDGLAACPEDVMEANPITYVDADDPPFIIGHGDEDCTVAPGQSVILDAALQDAGVPSELFTSPNTGHEIASCPPDEDIDGFLDDVFGVTR